jgi:hypothetical protein
LRSCDDLAYSFHGGGLLVDSLCNYNLIRFPSPFLSFWGFWNRLNGDNDNKGAPMACCMVYWGNNIKKFQSIFLRFGAVVSIVNLIGKRIGKEKNTNNELFEEKFIAAQSFA